MIDFTTLEKDHVVWYVEGNNLPLRCYYIGKFNYPNNSTIETRYIFYTNNDLAIRTYAGQEKNFFPTREEAILRVKEIAENRLKFLNDLYT